MNYSASVFRSRKTSIWKEKLLRNRYQMYYFKSDGLFLPPNKAMNDEIWGNSSSLSSLRTLFNRLELSGSPLSGPLVKLRSSRGGGLGRWGTLSTHMWFLMLSPSSPTAGLVERWGGAHSRLCFRSHKRPLSHKAQSWRALRNWIKSPN